MVGDKAYVSEIGEGKASVRDCISNCKFVVCGWILFEDLELEFRTTASTTTLAIKISSPTCILLVLSS
jgi:hypothetical protein